MNFTFSGVKARKIKKDAVEMGATLSEYALAAFASYLSQPIAARRGDFPRRAASVIRLGRKIVL